MTLHLWRHPRPMGVDGRCIGVTDVAVDRRKAKRLAHRIRQQARRQGWPRVIHTSDLLRCADVGRWLKRWGWRHVVCVALREKHFGVWEGRRWDDIPHAEVNAWVNDFLRYAPQRGESLFDMFQRVSAWQAQGEPVLMVAHAGWMQCATWLRAEGDRRPQQASEWPRAPAYGAYRSVV